MILKQYYLGCLAQASYLIGDEETGAAAVVDPRRDVELYLEEAGSLGLRIEHVFLTHFHADFVAGHLELRDRAGARIFLGARAQAEYDFTPLKEGDTLEMGRVRLRFLETPGHTPEGISILVYDLADDPHKPNAVLTGDTLFIGDVGRPDLMASAGTPAADLAAMLYDSLRTKLLTLPDETMVYPGHGAGSMCGKNLSSETVSTIGVQRQYNYALQPMSREQFTQLVTEDRPEAPSYFAYDAMLNRGERPVEGHGPKPLSLSEVLELQKGGVQVLDVRDPMEFEGAHMVGSINVGLGGQFASWAGILLDRDRPIILVAGVGAEEEAVTRLRRVGLDQTLGYLQRGMVALIERPDLVGRTERVTAATLAEQLASPGAPMVLDVRTEPEWGERHIQGSFLIPLGHLRDRIEEIPRDRSVVVHCASGYRSCIAASLLKHHSPADIIDMVGGISAWEASGLPTMPGVS